MATAHGIFKKDSTVDSKPELTFQPPVPFNYIADAIKNGVKITIKIQDRPCGVKIGRYFEGDDTGQRENGKWQVDENDWTEVSNIIHCWALFL